MDSKKIALINPPSPFLINQRVFPNIGIVRVATHLKADKHNVSLFDFAGDKNYMNHLNIGKFDAYLFSSTTAQFPYTYQLFKGLKSSYPNAQYIIGGVHASAISSIKDNGAQDYNIDTLNEFDTVFNGEGENTENLFKKGWVKGNLIKNIDDTLIPDFTFIDIKSYKYSMFNQRTANIMTQRGCPFQCNFCCGRDIEMYNKTRFHSPERVIEEMDRLNKGYGFKSFMWQDDEINLNPNRLGKLCEALTKRDYQHRGFVRSDLIVKYPETVKMLKEAGFVKLCTGVESGSDKVLKNVGKGVTSKENLKAREIIREAGIHYEPFLMIGLPGETKIDVELTVGWMKKAQPNDFDINIMVPYPGSKIYDKAVKSNKFKGYEWEYNGLYFQKPNYSQTSSYFKGINGRAEVNSRTDDMTEEYLNQRREEIQCQLRI